ncbi:hypothetical protein N0V90_006235 [Kalmusia sp. IMI 367209]|nr:hypothetical protein N0V90_006235 [Kalmusia sp. IMI 367209]
MKYAITPLAFAVGSSALAIRQSQQCVQLQASGGASGTLGQLSDGQNRVGGGYGAACYCLDSNGGFTDSNGRGCILTPPTTQFQCDEGASPTNGFAINGGSVTYNGNSKFYACPVNDNGEYNVYTQPAPGQDKCVEITLGSGQSCGAGNQPSASPSKPAQSQPAQSSAPQSSPAPPATPPAQSYPVGTQSPKQSQPPQSQAPPAPSQPGYSQPPKQSQPPAPSQPGYSQPPKKSQPPAPSQPAPQPPQSQAPPPSSQPGQATLFHPRSLSLPPRALLLRNQSSPLLPPAPSQPAPSSPPSYGNGTGSGCSADLNGEYQYPHLIVPVSSSKPSSAPGTSYNGSANGDVCSLFNFDIPQSYSGKSCSLLFLFPKQEDLETSSYTISGSGGLEFSQCETTATEQTSWNNKGTCKAVKTVDNVAPGNSYSIVSDSCAAGKTVTYQMCATGGLALNYFQDYNPSPIGAYIREC